MIFVKFLFFTKGVQYKRGSLESDTKINSMLFVGKLIVSFALVHKNLPYYKDFFRKK